MNNPGCILMELVGQAAQGTPEQGFGTPGLRTWEEKASSAPDPASQSCLVEYPWKGEDWSLACGLHQ